MALELRQQLKLSQQLIMTPQLQLAIKLLQLNRLELLETIRQELEENPALEEIAEANTDETFSDDMDAKADDPSTVKEITIEEKIGADDIDWSNYLDEYNSTGMVHFETEKRDSPNFETFIASKSSLDHHLLWQLLMTFPTPEEETIGSLIIGNLNRDGFLDAPLEEIIHLSGASEEKVNQVLTLLQTFDPIGVCARNIKDSLLIQARYFKLDSGLVTKIILHHLNHLENKNYGAIARSLKTSVNSVIRAVDIIKSLEPRPGRQFTDEEPQYISPDIFVSKFEDDFVIYVNDDGMPKLRLNAFYKNSFDSSGKYSANAKAYVQEKIRSASWLIRSIQQRKKTIYKVMESILKFQRGFFEKGVTHLKPMVLKDVAEDIDMHESTVSRVTNNKYVHTPQGIFELKFFFNSSIKRVFGEDMASASVQEKMRHLIDNEDPYHPYSDEKIAQLLNKQNINIARRTVAKYREKMRVLPSNKRKRYS
jgi:RNA polymerase sigma-54 factor